MKTKKWSFFWQNKIQNSTFRCIGTRNLNSRVLWHAESDGVISISIAWPFEDISSFFGKPIKCCQARRLLMGNIKFNEFKNAFSLIHLNIFELEASIGIRIYSRLSRTVNQKMLRVARISKYCIWNIPKMAWSIRLSGNLRISISVTCLFALIRCFN